MSSTEATNRLLGEPAASNVVNFTQPDMGDPMQWPRSKKIAIVVNISLLAAFGSMSCSLIAPAVPLIMKEFSSSADSSSSNSSVAVLVVTIFLLGQAVGLLFISSLSELYGRAPVFQATNVLFVIFAAASAASGSLGQLIAFRFLLGLAGACPPSIGGGVIGDMFPPAERGRATSAYAFGLILGPLVGPIIGGYIAEGAGWRWTCWLVVILSSIMSILSFATLRETYRPLLLDRRVRSLVKETGREDWKAALPYTKTGKGALMRSLVKPLRLLVTTPTILIPALSVSVIYGFFYLVISTMATIFQEVYRFSVGASGLAYLGFGIGLVFGNIVFGVLSDRAFKALVKSTGGTPKPEMRLAPICLGSPLAFVALLLYGWGVDKDVHWMLPVVGTAVYGVALVTFMLPVTTYLIEVYKQNAAGPVGANAMLRQFVGALLPLCANNLYARLGQGWGNTLLAFIALIFAPIPYLFYKHGEKLRERFSLNK
ncbi:major facilitator superfamily domain-containing protein [Xylariales sp. PMI_506]|nr:major facilitator superfamily domain-containing protein [Xylariales sp. PMI_506]